MNRWRLRIALLAAGLIVAACGVEPGEAESPTSTLARDVDPTTSTVATTTSAPAPSTSTSSPDFVSTGELDVIVPPDENGDYPPDLMVTCPIGPAFPLGAIYEIELIDPDDPDGMLAAIEPFLSSEEGPFWPQEGWQLLHQTSEQAILVTLSGGGLWYMYLSREDDAWRWGGSSSSGRPCDLQFAMPAGLNTVGWVLHPSAPEPGPETTELHVLLTEQECVSGQEIGDRLVGPQVVMTDTEVRLAFAAERPPGDAQTCQGNPETPYTVELPEPLGDREIIEAMSIGIRLEDYVS
ncbi:MAG: hypothetical protein Q8Q29_10890 [Actinomycetota bacterium]|nr:hypothetical protein [Actinomycetota bacterium]